MLLNYPSAGVKPVILVLVEDVFTGTRTLFPMLLDTGADQTCFPAGYAALFGHNNLAKGVATKSVTGVGGKSQGYTHSVRLVLVDPIKSTKGNFVPAWTSSLDKAVFVAQLTMTMGLIGRDVMQEWKSFALIPTPHNATSRWQITIRA